MIIYICALPNYLITFVYEIGLVSNYDQILVIRVLVGAVVSMPIRASIVRCMIKVDNKVECTYGLPVLEWIDVGGDVNWYVPKIPEK